jgi:threonine dehydrogenase-like Zn-dependent dehydrogenase
VIDAAGTTESLQQCIHLAKPGARMILLATYWGGMQIPGFDLCMKEINVIPAAQYNRLGPRATSTSPRQFSPATRALPGH